MKFRTCLIFALAAACKSSAPSAPAADAWEVHNPLKPLPKPPLGVQADFAKLPWVTPEKVRLGRWLFFDKRLSLDGSVACASCHRPENAFSEPTAHSTGVGGKQGDRKSPTFVNGAWPLFPVYFWDGRAPSLKEQAKGPIANPIEMASTHARVVITVAGLRGYQKVFKQAFGDDRIDLDRVAEAIAAYETTRLSGNSKFDRFDAGDAAALNEIERKGRELFFGKAQCNQCHFGWNFTDSQFHNLGVGWDAKLKKLTDEGRAKISGKKEELGAFKTPTLRDVSKHAPYMHDGSLVTLREVVEHYNKGGIVNPNLSPKVFALKLSPDEVDAVVEFLKALDGEGYADSAPAAFPE